MSGKEAAVGRIIQTWELVGRSFAILKSDTQLMLLPVVSGVFCILVSVVILDAGALVFAAQIQTFVAGGGPRAPITQGMWVYLFLFYLANYFVVVFFNVALVSTASSRLAGGHASVNDGLQTAWERKGKILQWALLAATVGVLLRMLEERMAWLGRFVAGLIGVAWTLASYFVVPVLALEDVGPAEALQRSADLFRDTWGEQVVGGFSFELIFALLALPGIALPLLLGRNLGRRGVVVGAILAVIYWLCLAITSAAVKGIFVAALYRYAKTKEIPVGFRLEDFSMAWQAKR